MKKRMDGRAPDQLRPVRLLPDFTENPLASVLCEALGRIGLREQAVPALARYLEAEADSWRAGVAGRAEAVAVGGRLMPRRAPAQVGRVRGGSARGTLAPRAEGSCSRLRSRTAAKERRFCVTSCELKWVPFWTLSEAHFMNTDFYSTRSNYTPMFR